MSEEKKEGFSYESPKKQLRNATKLLVLEIAGLAIGVTVVIGILMYFGVIPSPNFPFLTPSNENMVLEQSQIINEIGNDVDLPYAPCPIAEEIECEGGRVIDNGEEYYGAGYTDLPAGTKIIAIIPGDVEVQRDGDVTTISISDSVQKVTYEFVGNSTLPEGTTTIAQFQEIGEIINSRERVQENNILAVSFYVLVTNEYSRFRISGEDGSYVKKRIE